MKVVFDGACFADGPITGVGRSFLTALAAYARLAPGVATLLVPRGCDALLIDGVPIVDAPRGALRRQLALPRLLHRLQASVLHSSVAAVPLRAPCPTIATVHDLPWLAAEADERTSWWRRTATTAALRAAAAIVVPSAATRDAVRRLVARDPAVHLIPHGVDEPPDGPAVPRDGPFLVLGFDRPRKNRERVAQAHALASRRRPDLPPLRFVGPPDAYVDEVEKARLLRTCRAVVQCSLFEGFGMPVLEAMAHGAPLLCSDIPPFRELADGVALFVDPRDVDAIAAGLLQIAAVTDDARIAAGRRRARQFSAATTAANWHALHRALIAP